MKTKLAQFFCGVVCAMLGTQASATTMTSNFSDPSLSAGIYANGAAINTGTLNLAVTNTVGAASGYTVQVATSAITSNKAIQLIDNTLAQQLGGVRADVASLASGGYLSGSCTFAELPISSGSRGVFVFAITNNTYTSSTTSAFQLTFSSSGGNVVMDYQNGSSSFTAKNGGTNINFSLSSLYTIQWWVDFTNSSQDTYGFSIYDNASSLIFSSGTLSTRAANMSTSTLYMYAFSGNETTVQGPDPFVEIHSLSVSNAIPEPQTWALVAFGFVLLTCLYRGKVISLKN